MTNPGLGRSLVQEARVLLAEWLLQRALRMMPEKAPEAVPMAKALGDYADEVMKLKPLGTLMSGPQAHNEFPKVPA